MTALAANPRTFGHADVYRAFDGQRIVFTGATGFVGASMLHALIEAVDVAGIKPHIVALSRDPAGFRRRHAALAAHPILELQAGDVREPIAVRGPIDLIVHAATQTNVALTQPAAIEYIDASVIGMQRVLDLARRSDARLLFLSSGAVYGSRAFAHGGASEEATDAPPLMDPRAAYGNAKRASEAYLAAAAEAAGSTLCIARLFAFVGPYVPLHSGYAVGNFIADALRGGPIVVHGDGTPIRSYLDARDMADWLWALTIHGRNGRAYNVGSERAVSIAELAHAVSRAAGGTAVTLLGNPASGVRPRRYVPATNRIRSEVGVRETVLLEEALAHVLAWHAGAARPQRAAR